MKKRLSIKNRVAINAVIFKGILTASIAIIGYRLYVMSVEENTVSYADTVLKYAYSEAEEYAFGDMIKNRVMPEGYEELRAELNKIKENSSIEYLHAIYFEDPDDIHSLHYAINTKTKAEIAEAQKAGKAFSDIYTFMGTPVEEGGFEDDTLLTLQQAVKTKKADSGTLQGYSDVYGHMLNGYHVVFDGNDDAVGLICVEIDINRIYQNLYRYIRWVIFIAAIFTTAIVVLYVILTKRYLVGPIEKIAKNSNSFVEKMRSGADPGELHYEPVKVKKGESWRCFRIMCRASRTGFLLIWQTCSL